MKIAQQFRDAGINTDIDLNEKGPSKNLEYANSLGIPFVLFVGKKELQENKLKLRDMKTGNEEMMGFDEFCLASLEEPQLVHEVIDSLAAAQLHATRAAIEVVVKASARPDLSARIISDAVAS